MSIQAKIEDLIFDVDNPRFESLSDQRTALQKIVTDQKDKLFILAEDITAQGLNPADLTIVIESEDGDGRYVVLEGNRRLAALKLLSNPRLFDSITMKPSLRKKFQDLIIKFNKNEIEPINCVLCESRQEADHWRMLRHTGENRGAGIVGWDGIATARFTGKDVSLQALNFVRNQGGLKISDPDKFPITNLGRLLGTPHVRDVLGIDIIDGKLCSELPSAEVLKGLNKIITDIQSGNIKVTHIMSKQQRERYADKLGKSDRPDKSKKTQSWYLESEEKVPKDKSKKSLRQSTERKNLIPRDCILRINDPRINAIYKELRTLNIDKFSNAVSVLMRVFLELTTDFYITDKSLPGLNLNNPNLSLHEKVKAVADHLVKSGVPRNDLKGIRAAVSSRSSPFSISTLHSYMHSRYNQPKTKDLLIDWDNVRIFFEKIWL
ncbi:MAG: hypothetical protein ABR911_01590 [Syntrophales bacterium]